MKKYSRKESYRKSRGTRKDYLELEESKDFLNSLPSLCIWARNSLFDILSHSLLNCALILWSSCINFGSLFFMLNLHGGRYFNHRVTLLAVNCNNGQFGFYFNHMFKINTQFVLPPFNRLNIIIPQEKQKGKFPALNLMME